MKSLKAAHHELSDPGRQLQILGQSFDGLPRFEDRLSQIGLQPLSPTQIEILQVNVGKMCNQTCAHCHVDAGPDRQEIMTRETMKYCLKAIEDSPVHTVDIYTFRQYQEMFRRVGNRMETGLTFLAFRVV